MKVRRTEQTPTSGRQLSINPTEPDLDEGPRTIPNLPFARIGLECRLVTQRGLLTKYTPSDQLLTNELFSQRNVSKLMLEGAVVVASILIAFALDAWWDDRQLQQETVEDLAIVQYELAENIRLIQVTMDIMNQVIAANDALIAKLVAQPDSAFVEIEDTTIFWGIFSNPTFDPSLGGTDAWIAAGRLGGLGSPLLRQRLASVRGKVEDVVEEQRIAREIAVREIYPLLKDGIGDIGLVQELFSDGLHARQRTSVQVVSGSGTIKVPNSSALRFLLRARTLWYEASIYETGDFRTELEEIQLLLEDEIRRLGGETANLL
jgi:hypothetical protein